MKLLPNSRLFSTPLLILVIAIAHQSLYGQHRTGSIAPDFTLPIWSETESMSLYDLEGSIIVLDFFAYWCGPCQTSSPDLEENIQRYYDALNGTPNGIPVHVLPINIESDSPSQTNNFIESAGLAFALDDSEERSVYAHYSTGGIPLFVIINGVAGSPSHQQWEVVYHQAGYAGATAFRDTIQSVQASSIDPSALPEFTTLPPPIAIGTIGDRLEITVNAIAPVSIDYSWRRAGSDQTIASGKTLEFDELNATDTGAYEAVLTSQNGTTISPPFEIFAHLPGKRLEAASTLSNPSVIPDLSGTPVFSEFTLEIPDDQMEHSIEYLYINLNIEHAYRGDLSIELESPENERVILKQADGSDAENDISWTKLKVEGFEGNNPAGLWTLRVADNFEQDSGFLNSWRLSIQVDSNHSFSSWLSKQGFSNATTDPTLDHDNDGTCLLQEYALRMDGPLVHMDFLNTSKTRAIGLDFQSPFGRADVQYLLEVSEDMESWTLINYSASDLDDDSQTHRALYTLPENRETVFVRLICELIPEN
ncbi:antioxidant, AhpC/TSA family [Verrucomicrobiia bacterium DG1235]|nr:antioxidant, AhpC/TSA family [Verrucomicrobiae bacterium DG1235]